MRIIFFNTEFSAIIITKKYIFLIITYKYIINIFSYFKNKWKIDITNLNDISGNFLITDPYIFSLGIMYTDGSTNIYKAKEIILKIRL